MNKLSYTILLFVCLCGSFASCDNGAYTANPGGSPAGVVNPLHPLTSSEFTWSGTGPLGCMVNGTPFVSDSAYTTWSLDTSGGNSIMGLKGIQGISLYLRNVYAPNVYSMNFHSYYISGAWIDSLTNVSTYYLSYLGNSGEVKITENDSAYIRGLFYFEGISTTGNIVAVTNGYFNIKKH